MCNKYFYDIYYNFWSKYKRVVGEKFSSLFPVSEFKWRRNLQIKISNER
jgi:hypothetical protein